MIGVKEKSGGSRPGAGRKRVPDSERRVELTGHRVRQCVVDWLKTQKGRGGRLIEDALIHCYSFNPEPPEVAHITYDVEEDRRRLQRVLDSVPVEYPLLRSQIKGQLKYAQPGYHLAWHILEYGVDLYHMAPADMELIEERINYGTWSAWSRPHDELVEQERKEMDKLKNMVSSITNIPVEDFQNVDDMEVILEKLSEMVGKGDPEAIEAASKMIAAL